MRLQYNDSCRLDYLAFSDHNSFDIVELVVAGSMLFVATSK